MRLRLSGLETRYLNTATTVREPDLTRYTCPRCGISKTCNPNRPRPTVCLDCRLVLKPPRDAPEPERPVVTTGGSGLQQLIAALDALWTTKPDSHGKDAA